MKTQHRGFYKFFLLLAIALFCQMGWSATVAGVKGKKILINLQGEPAQKGDLFYLLNSSGKKSAIIKIMAIKGNKALALLGKGKARKGYSLQYRPRKSGGGSASAKTAKSGSGSSSSGDGAKGSSNMYWGLIGGFAQDSMDVNLKNDDGTDRTEVSMSGSGFSFKGLLDYKLLESVWFRGMAGVEQFVTAGEAICAERAPFDEECSTDIMYFSLDLWARYVFTSGSFRPWAGAGFGLLVPLSKTSTALDEDSITNTSVMAAGLGFDWFTSDSFYVPVQIEYGLLPSSDDVTASIISFRVGAGFSF